MAGSGGVGRVRVLADAVNDLTAELRALRESLPKVDLSKAGPEALKALNRFAAAMEVANTTLATTNSHLATLAQRPLLGMLGGGAEAELQRLRGVADLLRNEVATWRRLVPG
jgi:hypothetical protein